VMAVKPEISYNFLYASSNPSNFYCEALKIWGQSLIWKAKLEVYT
jgi:hypothetical protein